MRITNKSYLGQLKLAIKNDQNIAQARKGLKVPLPVQRQEDRPLEDPIEIREKAFNHLVSLFGRQRAEAFLVGQTQDDLEKINMSWNTLRPLLRTKTGLTKKFFDQMVDRL